MNEKLADFVVVDDEEAEGTGAEAAALATLLAQAEAEAADRASTQPLEASKPEEGVPGTAGPEPDVAAVGRYRVSFLKQASLRTAVGFVCWGLPCVTAARWMPELWAHGVVGLGVIYMVMVGLFALGLGLVGFVSGPGYVRRAQERCREGELTPARMELRLRPKKKSIYGSTLCDADLSYADGRTETIKLIARDMDVAALLGDPIAKVTLVGQPFQQAEPRVVATAYGDLLEQPDTARAFGSWFMSLFQKKGEYSCARLEKDLYAVYCSLLFTIVYIPWWLSLIPATQRYLAWWMAPTFVAGFICTAMRIKQLHEARRVMRLREPAKCTMVANSHSKWNLLRKKITLIVTGEGAERKETMFGFVPKTMDGQPVEADLWFRNGAPWMVATNDAVLFNERPTQKWALASLALYLGALALMMHFYTPPKMEAPAAATTAQEFYDSGVDFKTYGWPDKARDALVQAMVLDPQGEVGAKAGVFLTSHIPVYRVAEEAREWNTKANNLTYKSTGNDAAKNLWQQCINKYPQFEWPYSNLARTLIAEGRTTEAVPLLERALQINPQYTNALHNMYVAKSLLGDRESGLEYLRRAAQSDRYDREMQSELWLVEHSI